MGKLNYVMLVGWVNAVRIMDQQSGVPHAMMSVKVARANREVGDHQPNMRIDSILVVSKDPIIIKKMENIKRLDTVLIKGVFAIIYSDKVAICPLCGKPQIHKRCTLETVNPIDLYVLGSVADEDEGVKFLSEHREISNQIFVYGNLIKDPKKKLIKSRNLYMTEYPIAIDRKYRVVGDQEETDYPWVKAYGKNAESDKRYLHAGSAVIIDGCIQARHYKRVSTCNDCGGQYSWPDTKMEIVPYGTEYVANYYTRDDADRIEKAKEEEAVKKAMDSLQNPYLSQMNDIMVDDVISDLDDDEI